MIETEGKKRKCSAEYIMYTHNMSAAAQWAGTNEQNVHQADIGPHTHERTRTDCVCTYIYTIMHEPVYMHSPAVPSEIWIYALLDAWGPVAPGTCERLFMSESELGGAGFSEVPARGCCCCTFCMCVCLYYTVCLEEGGCKAPFWL